MDQRTNVPRSRPARQWEAYSGAESFAVPYYLPSALAAAYPRQLSLLSEDAIPCLIQPLPDGLKVGHYEDDGLNFDATDRHGQALTLTTPKQLQSLQIIEEMSDWNRATLAFLLALPPGTRIVLYWC